MSWYYSGSPNNSPVDKYRFLTGDTDKDLPILQDEEITYIIQEVTVNGAVNENKLLARLYEVIVVRFAKYANKSKLGPQSEEFTERLKYYNKMFDFYTSKATMRGLSVPVYQAEKVFEKGMLGNV